MPSVRQNLLCLAIVTGTVAWPVVAMGAPPPGWALKAAYAAQIWQSQAPEQLGILVREAKEVVMDDEGCLILSHVAIQAEVLAVHRSASGLQVGDRIEVLYRSLRNNPEGVCFGGTTSAPKVKEGARYIGYLIRTSAGHYTEAAGNHSLAPHSRPPRRIADPSTVVSTPIEPDVHLRWDEPSSGTGISERLEAALLRCYREVFRGQPPWMEQIQIQFRLRSVQGETTSSIEWLRGDPVAKRMTACKMPDFRVNQDDLLVSVILAEPFVEPRWQAPDKLPSWR